MLTNIYGGMTLLLSKHKMGIRRDMYKIFVKLLDFGITTKYYHADARHLMCHVTCCDGRCGLLLPRLPEPDLLC